MWVSRKIFELYSRLVFLFYTPLKVTGRNNIPKDIGVIFASNHNSHSDTAIVAVSSKFGFNRLAMLAANDYWFDNKFRKFFFNLLLNLIPIDRNKSKINNKISLEQTLSYCRNFIKIPNNGIVMYPEGSRSNNGNLQSLKDGVSLFSLRLKIPIVPVYIKGSFDTWSKGKLFIRPGKLHVEFLYPIYPHKINEEYDKYFLEPLNSKVKKITKILNKRLTKAQTKYDKS